MMRALLTSLMLLTLITTPALAEDTIKLGAMFDLSGRAAFIGTPTRLVAEMVVEKINAEGGINGRKIELIIADTNADPAKTVSIVKKFIHKDRVVAIIGPTMTDTGMAVKKVVDAGKTPIFMTVGGDPVIMGGKYGPYAWVFKSPQRSSTAVERLFVYLKEKGLTKIALLSAADGFGKDGVHWMAELAPKYGIEIIARESFGTRDTDMTAQLTNVKRGKPQALVAWTIGPAGSIIAKNTVQLGIDLPLFQCHGLPDPKYIELAGTASEGNRMPSTKLMVADQLPDSDPQKPVIREFITMYRDKGYDKQFPINTHSGYAWDAIMIVADAIRKAGTDQEALRQAIEDTTGYVGISGIYTITPEDHNGLGVDSMVMVQVKNGVFTMAE
ncbi:ABC transporter substrate-binding protein [Desulfoprunum benzoelyticum]|uniref:Branched-chain amino acid transport system substrate-binding protein n=2 Tax=Desulfoprunum benzoelyticum TaxID=1506996 RepID=A0A840UV34_9BACT|nr:ABC transporter substrate-binding protein [Desulfoprunum benzoelyticum]MBB5347264.1 branched-chain amino acid transport system substrate-binding protein [Desulfoprunum benzoelyticum]MBM9531398.1 ABC transporter substrate-binding protein [Desulfoprunum benzoelyticum]